MGWLCDNGGLEWMGLGGGHLCHAHQPKGTLRTDMSTCRPVHSLVVETAGNVKF